jgi:hypothetical protein
MDFQGLLQYERGAAAINWHLRGLKIWLLTALFAALFRDRLQKCGFRDGVERDRAAANSSSD